MAPGLWGLADLQKRPIRVLTTPCARGFSHPHSSAWDSEGPCPPSTRVSTKAKFPATPAHSPPVLQQMAARVALNASCPLMIGRHSWWPC